MTLFRLILVSLLLIVVGYTIPVVLNHGMGLLEVFFGDIMKLHWPGQFNMDFLGFLTLSAIWTVWRNNFSLPGAGLAVLAFFGGIPFLTAYLLILSFKTRGDIKTMLLGPSRTDL